MTKREWLKQARKEQKLTLKELAGKIECSLSYIADLEAGRRTPSGKIAYRLAKTLGFQMEKFFIEREDEVNASN